MKTLLIIFLTLFYAGQSHSQILRSLGDVRSASTNELIYQEHHTFSKPPAEEFMQTEYKTLDGSLIAKRKVNFINGYASDYVFEQVQPKLKSTVVREADQIQYINEKNGEVETKTFSVDDLNSAVVNAGMFNAVEREWDRLINSEKVAINLVVPERGRTFSMNIKQVKLEDSKMSKHMEVDGKIVFNLVIASRLLRLLVAPVELGYDTETKRLVFYHGPSNLRTPDGKKYGDIWITYKNS